MKPFIHEQDLPFHAQEIIQSALQAADPWDGVVDVLNREDQPQPTHLLAIGKAALRMTEAALSTGLCLKKCLVITKEGHTASTVTSDLRVRFKSDLEIVESAHPVPDERSLMAAEKALALAQSLDEKDHLLLLISGGGSALVEAPIPGMDLTLLQKLTQKLLAAGADIHEINAIRKHFSKIKGGRLAQVAAPASITQILLSDVLGDPPDVIASGPATADRSTCAEVRTLLQRYAPTLLLPPFEETPKQLPQVRTFIRGSVRQLCQRAQQVAEFLGYRTLFLSDQLNLEAREAGRFLAQIARAHLEDGPLAIICGGETTVTLKGSGKGGRNQELALSASSLLPPQSLLFSLGSDGSDGPTDAAGAMVTAQTWQSIPQAQEALDRNDSYTVLDQAHALIRTGPTGTNVNDLTVLLIASPQSASPRD